MKLFAALGSGDIVAAHRAIMCEKPLLSEMSIIYSGQLIEYCREQGIEMLALSHNGRTDSVCGDLLQLENCPRIFEGRGGVRYHVSMVARAVYLACRAWRFGADLAVIDSGSTHYFALTVFRLFNISVAVDFHNTLWPSGFEPKRSIARMIRHLDALFFRYVADGAIGVSPECRRQSRQLARHELPFFEYRGQFRRTEFRLERENSERNPFHVIFVGRAERNKGLLDIPAIAERLRERSSVPILFDVCGDGGALNDLRRIVKAKRLDDIVRIHGRLARPELLKVYARAHAVIVPTRSDFCEGLPLVCAEAVLSGVPIVTSRLSNAIPVLGPSIVEAEPEDIESYVDAILKLVNDQAFYENLRAACPELERQFFDRSQSYPAAIDRLIAHLFPRWKLLSNYEPLFKRIA